MHQSGDFAYARMDGFQALEMPYRESELVMQILLPSAPSAEDPGPIDRLAALEKKLSPKLLGEIDNELKSQKVQVMLPKFEVTREYRLNEGPLQAMGMKLAFDSGRADFSGLTDSAEQLFISLVQHQADVGVSEWGTEAAGATAVVIGLAAEIADRPPTFNADHPFVFLIRDKTTGAVLFLGRMTDPR